MSSTVETATSLSTNKSSLSDSFFANLSIIIVLSILLELIRAAQFRGFARAESCFVEGAREMFAAKQYIAPLFYGVPYFDKPPLFYWLIISAYKIFNVSLLNARAVSIFASALTVFSSAVFVKRIAGEKTAILTAVILATTLGFFEFSSIAMPDMWLCLFENIAVFSAYMLFINNANNRWQWLFAMVISFALGWMTKGPVALVIPGIAIAISLAIFKQVPRLSFKEFAVSLLVFLLFLAPWHWQVYSHYGLSAFNWLYVQGNFGRFIGQHNAYNFGHKPTYMLTNLLGSFLPWTIFLVPAFGKIIFCSFTQKSYLSNNKFVLLMAIWATFNTLLFSLSSSNWGYYSLPIFPALAIITAHFLIELEPKFSARNIQIICATIAIGFFLSLSVYCLVFLPKKAKRNSYLNFAHQIKVQPITLPFYFHCDLFEQCLLTDYIMFEAGRLPVYCDQAKLTKMTLSSQPFMVLIPRQRFENLQSLSKTKLQIIDMKPFTWLNFPGCQLIKEAPNGTPIVVVLAIYKPAQSIGGLSSVQTR